MVATLTSFFDKPWTKIILSYLVVLCIGIGVGVYGHIRWQTPPAAVVRTVTDTKYVDVPVDKIIYRDAVKYVQDKTEVTKLLKEMQAQKDQIATLTETIANFKPTVITKTETQFVNVPGANEAHFKDWRLTFDATQTHGTAYTLDQKFEVLSAVGKDTSGKPVFSTKLFEIGPGDTRTPLTDAHTTVVSAIPNPKKWRLTGSVQAGFGYSYDTSAKKGVSGGVVGLQWLKRGTSKAAEDSTISLLTPVAFISPGVIEPGLLPVSVNLGRIPKQPFRDLWVSPMLAFGKAPNLSPTRAGFVLTATF